MGMSTIVLDVTKAESVAACKKQVETIPLSEGPNHPLVGEIEGTNVRIDSFDPGKTAGTETVSTADRIAGNVPVEIGRAHV